MDSDAPGVTVLLAVHNGERFLRAALESILAQSYRDFELLVVDDGSTDRTAEILASCDDARLRVIGQERCGLTRSLNRGLAAARGAFVARMDADDISAPDRLLEQVRALENDPELGLVGCRYLRIDEKGRALRLPLVPVYDAAIRDTLVLRNPFCHSAVTFRRRLVEEVGGYDTALELSQDYDLWFRLAPRCRMWNHPGLLHSWRRARSGISVARLEAQNAHARSIRERHLRAWLASGMLTADRLAIFLRADPGDRLLLGLLEEVVGEDMARLSLGGRCSYLEARFLADPETGSKYLERLASLHLEADRTRLARMCRLELLRREPRRTDISDSIHEIPPSLDRHLEAPPTPTELSVSVVVPVQELDSDAAERLASVRAQIGPGVEVVVVDGTGSEAAWASEPGVRYCRIHPGALLFEALNAGVDRARGEHVAFLIRGYRFRPGHLGALLKAIRSGPYGLAISGVVAVREAGWGEQRTVLEGRLEPGVRHPEDLVGDRSLGLCNVLVRRGLLDRVGRFDDELEYAVGPDLWFRCAEVARVIRVAEATCERRDEVNGPEAAGTRSFEGWLVRNHHAHLRGRLAFLNRLIAEGRENEALRAYRELKAGWRGSAFGQAVPELLALARRFRDSEFCKSLEGEQLRANPVDFLRQGIEHRDWWRLIRSTPPLVLAVGHKAGCAVGRAARRRSSMRQLRRAGRWREVRG